MASANNIFGYSRMGFATGHSVTNFVVDAPTKGIAWIFQPRSTSPISALFFRYGTRTGTPPTYRYSLQNINATGFPDGTVLGGGTPASGTFRPPNTAAWDGSGQWITLENTYSPVSRGVPYLAAVIEHDPVANDSVDVSNNGSFGRGLSDLLSNANQLPYSATRTASVWTKITGNTNVCFAVQDADGVYGVPFASTFNSTIATTGQRHAAAITVPFLGVGSTYTVGGIAISSQRIGAVGASAIVGIWDSTGAVISSFTIDTDQMANPTNAGLFHFLLPTPAVLNFGTKYFFGVEVVGGSPLNITGINLARDIDRAAYPNGLNRAHALWNGSAWVETNTRLPYVDLMFEDITASGGAVTAHPLARSRHPLNLIG